MSKLFQLQCWH